MIENYPEVSVSPEGRVLQWEQFETWLRLNDRTCVEIISKLRSLNPYFMKSALCYNMDREKVIRLALFAYFERVQKLEEIIKGMQSGLPNVSNTPKGVLPSPFIPYVQKEDNV